MDGTNKIDKLLDEFNNTVTNMLTHMETLDSDDRNTFITKLDKCLIELAAYSSNNTPKTHEDINGNKTN